MFQHTKSQLEIKEDYKIDSPVSFVLSIPAIWSPKATHILQEIVISAIQMTGFCQLRHGCLDDLFIVTEPEAAATFLMATNAKIIVRSRQPDVLEVTKYL